MGVLGALLYPGGAIEKYLQVPESSIYAKFQSLPVFSVLTIKNPHTKPPPYDFLNLYGAPACTEDPKIQVLDNLPRYG
jgi:hypothetical protein